MKNIILAIFIFGIMVSHVEAKVRGHFVTGLMLKKFCDQKDKSFCNGYIAGMLDVYSANDEVVCLYTAGKQVHQYVLLVQKFFDKHPLKLHMNAEILVFLAIITYGCVDPPK